jgi:hypothetical protein
MFLGFLFDFLSKFCLVSRLLRFLYHTLNIGVNTTPLFYNYVYWTTDSRNRKHRNEYVAHQYNIPGNVMDVDLS